MSFKSPLHHNLSVLLEEKDRARVLELLGKRTEVPSSGMAQLLRLNGSEWEERADGIVCYTKDHETRTKSIIFIDTSSENARIVETFNYTISNVQMDDKKDLITFHMNAETVGLLFYSEVEAALFHAVLIAAQHKSELRRVASDNIHGKKHHESSEDYPFAHQLNAPNDMEVKFVVQEEIKEEPKKKENTRRLVGIFHDLSEKRKEKKNDARRKKSAECDAKFYDGISHSSSSTDFELQQSATFPLASKPRTSPLPVPPIPSHIRNRSASPNLVHPSTQVNAAPVQAIRPPPQALVPPQTTPPPQSVPPPQPVPPPKSTPPPQSVPPPLPAPRPSLEIILNKTSRPCCEESSARAEKAEKERDEMAARLADLDKKYRKALVLLAKTKLNDGGSQYETALAEFVQNACKIGVQGLLAEFAEIRQKTQPIGAIPRIAFDTNMDKNRYRDVYCVDESRVVLHGGSSDYIHANWVEVPAEQRNYICTQGPMESTVDDFWRMIWQIKCRSIVMLCTVVELGVKKCEQYWPEEVGQEVAYGALRVHATAKEEFEGLMTVTKLTISDGSNPFVRNTHELEHILWHDWPDRGVPADALACVKLVERVKNLSPTVIHCSAGIGRTGTIVALDLILSSLKDGEVTTAKEVMIDLRSKRHGSIQMDIQYLYLHRVLVALGLSMEVVQESEVKEFIDAYDALCRQRGFI